MVIKPEVKYSATVVEGGDLSGQEVVLKVMHETFSVIVLQIMVS